MAGKDQFTHVASKVRRNVVLLLEKEVADAFVESTAPVILGLLSRYGDMFGKIIRFTARYEKLSLIFFKLGDMHVVVSIDPGQPSELLSITKKIEEKYLITPPAAQPERFCVHCGKTSSTVGKYCPHCGEEQPSAS